MVGRSPALRGPAQGWPAAAQNGHGGDPAMVERDLSGKKAGKEQGFAGKLTAGSVWAEGGRRGKID